MELTQEKKTQIAACHGKGMTLSEIAARCGLVEGVVEEFLKSIGKTPNKSERRSNTRLTEEQKQQLNDLFREGKGVTEISKITGINIKTVDYYKPKLKEKEPASAATDTSSVGCIKKTDGDTVSLSKDTTIEPKSQALLIDIRKRLLTIYETLGEKEQLAWDLGELYAKVKEGIGDEDT